MSRMVLYQDYLSPPCRSVLQMAAVLGIDLEIRNIDLLKFETRTEEFLKINPQHTLPTLDDNGFIIWESNAIVCYLADKYAKDDSLYPKDLQKRATINQRLHFNSGVMFASMRAIIYQIFFGGVKEFTDEMKKTAEQIFDFLGKFLDDRKWLAGDSYTVADICCMPTALTFSIMCGGLENYPKVSAWIKRCEQEIPGYAEVEERVIASGRPKLFFETLHGLMQKP